MFTYDGRFDLQLFAEKNEGDFTPDAGDSVDGAENFDSFAGDSQEPQSTDNDDASLENAQSTDPDADNYVPKERVQEIIRERLSEEKSKRERLAEQYSKYESAIEKLKKASNLSEEQIFQYIDQQTQQALQQNPNAQYYDEMEKKLESANSVTMDTRRMLEEDKLLRNPMYSDYEEIKDDVREFADDYGISLERAYWAVNGSEKAEKIRKQAEQKALESAKKRSGLGAESDSHAKMQELGLTQEEMSFAKELGIDLEEMSMLGKISSLEDYRKYKDTKKK